MGVVLAEDTTGRQAIGLITPWPWTGNHKKTRFQSSSVFRGRGHWLISIHAYIVHVFHDPRAYRGRII
jgi:hypothetical protein